MTFCSIFRYVNWITVRPYEHSIKKTTLTAPLYSHPADEYPEKSINWTTNYLIENGVPSAKIFVPVLARGLLFELDSADEKGLNVPAHSRWAIYSRFGSLCSTIRTDSWTVVHDTDRVGTYAYLDSDWNSYQDVGDVQRISEYVLDKNLGGGSYFEVYRRDVEDNCECGIRPLLNAFAKGLNQVADSTIHNCT